jgi:hypothetical protein
MPLPRPLQGIVVPLVTPLSHRDQLDISGLEKLVEWKLVRDFRNTGRDELYDLKNDPEEHRNLIGSPDARVQKMRKQLAESLLRMLAELGDPLGAKAKE